MEYLEDYELTDNYSTQDWLQQTEGWVLMTYLTFPGSAVPIQKPGVTVTVPSEPIEPKIRKTEKDEPFFGTNIREAVRIIRDWRSSPGGHE